MNIILSHFCSGKLFSAADRYSDRESIRKFRDTKRSARSCERFPQTCICHPVPLPRSCPLKRVGIQESDVCAGRLFYENRIFNKKPRCCEFATGLNMQTLCLSLRNLCRRFEADLYNLICKRANALCFPCLCSTQSSQRVAACSL